MSDGRKNLTKTPAELSQPSKRKLPMSSPDALNRRLQPTQHPPPPPSTLTHNPLASFQNPTVPQHPKAAQQHVGKIAIPRLRRGSEGASAGGSSIVGDKHRVSHACEPCRHRKTKCSGERPVCKHCEDFRINCVYTDGKRDRTKKELGTMASRVEEYENLLRELSHRVNMSDQRLIRKALESGSTPDDEDGPPVASPKNANIPEMDEGGGEESSDGKHGESEVTARVGSTGSVDRIDEDFNRNAATRATGYMGKSAEVAWMQKLKERQARLGSSESSEDEEHPTLDGGQTSLSFAHGLHHLNDTTSTNADSNPPVSESTYHCDDLDVLIPDQVDPFEIPPKHTAYALYQSYIDTVHPAFPIIGQITFTNQVQTFLENDKIKTGHNWLAILNLIFAIAAKYSHLVQAEWRGDERDHLIYFTRARILGFNGETILGHAELQRVQITGLMAFYLMAINHINRSWSISGIAIRHAITLGLNLRNENRKVNESSKEIRHRVWWALCSTERMVAVMTGRPTSVLGSDCTVPLPLPVDEHVIFNKESLVYVASNSRRYSSSQDTVSTPSSTTSSTRTRASPANSFSPTSHHLGSENTRGVPPNHAMYFLYHTKLSILSNEVLDRLYRVSAISESWEGIQNIIGTLESKLEQWRSELPSVFDFTKKQRDQQFVRPRMSLGFFYYSTLMIINRPCLCRLDKKIPNQSRKSFHFNRSAAVNCVHAARDMMEMLPEEPNPIGLYKVAPWWRIIHHFVQAATVLMLELSFRSEHLPFEAEEVQENAKKAVHWLESMSPENVAAQRAWRLCNDLLQKVAPKMSMTVNGLPTPAFNPADWIENPFATTALPQNAPGTQSYSTHFPDASYYAGMQPDDLYFQPPMYAAYDDFSSPRQVPTSFPSPNMTTMYTVSSEMDGLISHEAQGQEFSPDYDQQWNPSDGVL